MKRVRKGLYVPQVFCVWPAATFSMSFSRRWQFWVCPEGTTYRHSVLFPTLSLLSPGWEGDSVEQISPWSSVYLQSSVRKSVIQTSSGLTLFCWDTQSCGSCICLGCSRFCSTLHLTGTASLTLPSFDSWDEWTVCGCWNSVLLCWACHIASWG